MRSIVRMKRHGRPIVFDATHSAQFPGKSGGKSGGDRSLVPALARAGVAAGADAIFIETHPDPDRALCDGPNSLALKNLRVLLASLAGIHDLINQADPPRESDSPPLPARPTELILSKEDKFRRVKLIVFDVDGVLTDGGIFLGSNEIEIKYFHVRDGHGIKIAIRSGLEVAFITGRKSEAVTRRAKELGISHVYQGVRDKVPAFTELASALGVSHEEIAVVGDDIVDIPIMRRAGVSFTVPEAPDEVRRVADVVVDVPGGRGAARKVIETVLRAQGKWDLVMERYFA
jgi:YrbI family 3-deoxy-D-manno-octulosonate 8-phosphate phosphatase